MTSAVFLKLLAIFVVIGVGWVAARSRLFGGGDAARLLSNAAFYLFAPALLFRTVVRVDFAAMPWETVLAFFLPAVGWLLLVYGWRRHRRAHGSGTGPAEPAVRAISATFGNSVQLGIPMAAALFGEAGLSIHLAIVSVHALILLSVCTLLAELDLARSGGSQMRLSRTLMLTARNTIIHPVVMPVLLGIAWNLAGLPLPAAADETLAMLGQAMVPTCLVAIGLSLAHYGIRGAVKGALWVSAGKLFALPLLVLPVGWLLGLRGLPLTVIVMAASLPTGSNAQMFSQRYGTQESETSTVMLLSTAAFVVTSVLWLSLLQLLPQQ